MSQPTARIPDPVNILFLISSMRGGGAERVTAMLANYWAQQGWRVTVATISGAETDFYALDERVHRVALNLLSNKRSPLSALINNFRRLRALRAILKSIKPTVAIGMMPTSNVLLALASYGLPVTAIGSERVHPPMLPLGLAWEFLRRRTYRLLSALVAQTADSAEWLRANVPAKKISVIPNPVSVQMSSREPAISPHGLRAAMKATYLLLGVGRLEPQKGFDRLIRAFRKSAESHPDWALIILGEGSQRRELEALIRHEGLQMRVALPGAVGNVEEWYEAGHLFALTSRFEGFPNVLVEAMANRMPVIAVDCDTGPRDIVLDKENGLLVPQDDAPALEDALEYLMSDDGLRDRLAGQATEVRTRFSLPSVAGAWEALFPDA